MLPWTLPPGTGRVPRWRIGSPEAVRTGSSGFVACREATTIGNCAGACGSVSYTHLTLPTSDLV